MVGGGEWVCGCGGGSRGGSEPRFSTVGFRRFSEVFVFSGAPKRKAPKGGGRNSSIFGCAADMPRRDDIGSWASACVNEGRRCLLRCEASPKWVHAVGVSFPSPGCGGGQFIDEGAGASGI